MSQKSKSGNADIIKVKDNEIKRIEREGSITSYTNNEGSKLQRLMAVLPTAISVGKVVVPPLYGLYQGYLEDKRAEKKSIRDSKNQELTIFLQHLDKELANEVQDYEKIGILIERIDKLRH